jgi:hypothetical protein
VVKGWLCKKDNRQQLLDLTQRLQMPGLLKVCCQVLCLLWMLVLGQRVGWCGAGLDVQQLLDLTQRLQTPGLLKVSWHVCYGCWIWAAW